MAGTGERQEQFFDKARDMVAAVAGKGQPGGYLGGELQAAFRQGFNELGSALKAFPDALQVDEPGAAFNPLYRDMAGDPQSQNGGPQLAGGELPTPSQIAGSAGSVHGETRQPARELPSPSELSREEQASRPEHGEGLDNAQRHGRSM